MKKAPKKPKSTRSPYVTAKHKRTVNFRPTNDQYAALHEICRAEKVAPSDLLRGALDRLIAEHTAKSA